MKRVQSVLRVRSLTNTPKCSSPRTTRDLWHFGLQLIGLKLDDLLVFVRISQLEPLRTKSHL
jgi:hypothetical protein